MSILAHSIYAKEIKLLHFFIAHFIVILLLFVM